MGAASALEGIAAVLADHRIDAAVLPVASAAIPLFLLGIYILFADPPWAAGRPKDHRSKETTRK